MNGPLDPNLMFSGVQMSIFIANYFANILSRHFSPL